MNFTTGTTFYMNGETHLIWRTTGRKVSTAKIFYVSKHTEAEDTFHEAKLTSLLSFVTAGLITF